MHEIAHTRTSRVTASTKARPSSRLLTAAIGLALALALSSTPGCMVMDELDNAAAKMPTTAKEKQAKAEAKQPKANPAASLADAKARVAAHSKKWWSEAKTMTPGEGAPTGVTSCLLPEGTKFMSTDDCLSQGGRPANDAS